jgi:hypothetical protein
MRRYDRFRACSARTNPTEREPEYPEYCAALIQSTYRMYRVRKDFAVLRATSLGLKIRLEDIYRDPKSCAAVRIQRAWKSYTVPVTPQ